MKPFRSLTAIEQLAAYLRTEMQAGALGETMPGVHRLAKELGVGQKSVGAAMALLEREGLVIRHGERRRCQILPQAESAKSGLRVGLLLYESYDRMEPFLLELHHLIENAGHVPVFSSKTLMDLGIDLERVKDYVKHHEVDAWVVFSVSTDILEWFATGPVPAFSVFGQRHRLPIAGTGPDKVPALREVVRRLVGLGHRKIVRVVREDRRKPQPAVLEQAFLDELAAQGITTGDYNLPEWEESPEGFKQCLDNLFRLTPPTALFLDEVFFFTIAQHYLARRGILSPEHVSLICSDPDPSFDWFLPRVSHIQWDRRPVVRRVVRWIENVAQGKDDRRQTDIKAYFVEGGTIGPVR